uniref:ATPase dynein-related AAA domain-containing protein n=1 Tax=Panagrolaimus sp. PS1159 TaxID=55785 RepID=A0AC35GTG1_9BILA
ETDASELLGSYEQVLDYKIIEECFDEFCNILKNHSVIGLSEEHSQIALKDLENIEKTDVHKLRCKIIQIAALVNAESQEKLNIIASKLSKVYLRFEWRSSVFVEAYKNGDWLLIEDVNCCSAAVLDRLNCCLESGGKLVLPEQIDGSSEEIEPHPSFRVFFTMDAKNGALSRAMKNRCVEFCIDEKNAWFGDFDSALNVMLLKEPLMCST